MAQTTGNSRLLPSANFVAMKCLALPGIVHAE
ncbi:hypothetical protein QFZ96_000580 [Paraburkholderia youngii]